MVLLSVVFILALLSPWTLSLPWLAIVLAAGGFLVRRPAPALAALSLVAAMALAGLARGDALQLPAPPTLTAVTRRVRARVVTGCLPDPTGERCAVIVDGYGLAALHIRQGVCGAQPGDLLDLVATVRPVIPLRNPPRVDPDALRVLRGQGYQLEASACDRVGRSWHPRDVVRRAARVTRLAMVRWLARSLGTDGRDQAAALLFGDTTALDADTRDAFRASGLAHLLAVSGAHVALGVTALGALTRRVLQRIPGMAARGLSARAAVWVPLPCVAFFILVTGESASSLRALLTGVVTALATHTGRRPVGTSLVAGVALAMAAVSPPWVLDPGWQLSVLAAFTLASAPRDPAGITPPDPPGGRVRGVLALARTALVASTRVAVAVTPLLAWLSGRAPAVATLANLLAAPLGEVVLLPGTLLAALAGALAPVGCAHAVGALLRPLYRALFALPSVALRLPLATVSLPVPTPAECVVATVTLAGALASRARPAVRWLAVGTVVVCTLEAVHLRAVHPTGVLRLTALDVGQGDALVVDLPDGTAMLVDGGGALHGESDPGARAVVPWLALHRRRSLAAVVLSHPHPDHAGGLQAVLRAVHTDVLWDTGQGRVLGTPGAYATMLATAHARGIPVVGPRSLCGPARPFHGAWMQVLAPCPGPVDGDTPNNASFVLRITLGRASVLLPGDLEQAGESRLLAALAPVTVLKVPHHGSRTSSTEAFLTALAPRVALVSCGHPSPFGHPHPSVLARVAAHGIALRRTDLSGAVSVTLHPDGTVE